MLWIKFSRKKASTMQILSIFYERFVWVDVVVATTTAVLIFFSAQNFFFFLSLFRCSFRCVINIDNIRSTNTFRSARQYIIYIFPSCTFKILNTDWILYEGVEIFIAFFLVRVIILPPALIFLALFRQHFLCIIFIFQWILGTHRKKLSCNGCLTNFNTY